MKDIMFYNEFVLAYIVFICFFMYKYSKQGTLYIFSPFMIFTTFILTDLIPIYMPHIRTIPPIMYKHNIMAIIVNVICVLCYNKMYLKKAYLDIPVTSYQAYKKQRKAVMFCCLALLLLSGLISGTLIGFLRGQNMEDARRTGEIGIGFIRELPSAMLQLIGIVFLIHNYKKSFIKAGIICFFFGVFEVVISGGNRGPLLSWTIIFLVYFGITYRGLRWWEYILYLVAFNVVAIILGVMRKGLELDGIFEEFTVFSALSNNQNIFYENSISLVNLTQDSNFFHGEEIYNAIVYFIPRFLWPDKPVSFGYKLKELAGYDFEGGGIGATLMENMYINWSDFWILNYIIWIWFVHKLYKGFLQGNSYYTKTIIMFMLIKGTNEVFLIRAGEILIISLIMFSFIYQKKKSI